MQALVTRYKIVPATLAALAILSAAWMAAPGCAAKQQEQTVAEENQKPGCYSLKPYKVPVEATELDKKLLSIMEKHRIVGLTAAVFRDNKVIWSSGYGWADLKSPSENTPYTIFRVASISKMMVGTALMQLYEQGKFGLDDDIGKYLGYQVRNPNFPGTRITFRHLLTHTSSIVDSGSYNRIVAEYPEVLREISLKDMLVPGSKYYSLNSFANYAPGAGFSYSNFGTGIAGSLVEAIAGMPLDKYCAENIFGPLKMDASFEPADIKNWQQIGSLYRSDDGYASFRPTTGNNYAAKPERTMISVSLGSALGRGPAGGVRANVIDLAKFMIAHMNGGSYGKTRILEKDTADLMHSMQWFGESLDGLYKQKGLNFHITDQLIPGQRFIGHSAEAYGLSGDAYFDPDTKFGMVFLFNGGHYVDANPFYSVENQVAQVLYSEFAPKQMDKPRKIQGKANSTLIVVNNRKIILAVPAAVIQPKLNANEAKLFFVTEISAADALKAGIELTEKGDTLTYTSGQNKVVLTVGNAVMMVNGREILLPQGPYQAGDHIMVPLRELSAALMINADIRY
jgi:CubicO group peptidase (beta-lactamase class C family)